MTTYTSTRSTQTPRCSRNHARVEHAILFFWLVPFACGSMLADDVKDHKGQPPGKGHSVVRDESSQSFEEQESESMEFVQSHHPELVALLQRLKSMKRDEYETAIRDIVKVRKRLETLEKRDLKLHGVELDAWKLQSKIDLLLARAVAQDKEFDPSALRTLVQKRIENQKENFFRIQFMNKKITKS